MIAAVLTTATLMTGCQSGGNGGATPLSLSGLTETADGVPEDGTSTCPLPYDMAKAAKAAGLDAEADAGPVKDDDAPVATAEGGKRAKPGDSLAENPGVLVSCTFHVGQDDVRVHTIATRKPNSVAPLAPVVSWLTAAPMADVIGYINKVGKAEPGEAIIADSGYVAAVRLKLHGDGDASLLVGAKEQRTASLNRKQVGRLAEALAEQVQ